MDSKAVINASCWIAISIIAATYIYIGGVNLTTNIIVGLLVVATFGFSFVLTFGLEGMKMRSPEAKAKIAMSAEITEIKTTVSALSEKVDSIKKELEA